MNERDPTVVLRHVIEEVVRDELGPVQTPTFERDGWREGLAREIALQVLQRLADLKIEVRR